MEIDHVFVFVEPDGAELAYLASLGLVETYRRTHAGQGTRNVCYCFDNMFLECLWVCDVDEIRSTAVARAGLYERSQWRTAGTSPFGIAWRTTSPVDEGDLATWAFRPPYLPAGMSIDVSVDGDDPRQPMMFRSPATSPPAQWPPARRGELQRHAGLGRVLAVHLDLPRRMAPGPALAALARDSMRAGCSIVTVQSIGETQSLTLQVERLDHGAPLAIRLPVQRPR